jgi:hypothetical protein
MDFHSTGKEHGIEAHLRHGEVGATVCVELPALGDFKDFAFTASEVFVVKKAVLPYKV